MIDPCPFALGVVPDHAPTPEFLEGVRFAAAVCRRLQDRTLSSVERRHAYKYASLSLFDIAAFYDGAASVGCRIGPEEGPTRVRTEVTDGEAPPA